jgi:hypothetical protein
LKIKEKRKDQGKSTSKYANMRAKAPQKRMMPKRASK